MDIVGTDAGEEIVGTNDDDILQGLGGDDMLEGLGGNDTLDGGEANDTASYSQAPGPVYVSLDIQGTSQNTASAGFDTLISIENLIGSAWGDRLTGNADANTIDGGGSSDTIYGGGGNDTLYGGEGDDFLYGETGADVMFGGMGNDSFYVDDLGDVVTEYEGEGDIDIIHVNIAWDGARPDYRLPDNIERGRALNGEILRGNALDNTLYGTGGAFLVGGIGDDTYVITATDAAVEGEGLGNDTVRVTFDYTLGSALENLVSHTRFASSGLTLTGNELDNYIRGSFQSDTLSGLDGDDTLEGDIGNDVLDGGAGSDTASYDLYVGPVTVSLALQGGAQDTQGAGLDTLISIENLIGSQFADNLTGDATANRIAGGDGDDELLGGAGDDTLLGDAGADRLFGDSGRDTLEGGLGDDLLDGGSGTDTANYANASAGIELNIQRSSAQDTKGAGFDTLVDIENVIGSAYDDRIIGSDKANRIDLGAGSDFANGRGGTDRLYGEAGDDVLRGHDGDDRLFGGDDDDRLEGGIGNDLLEGGDGADFLIGQAGTDILRGGAGDDIYLIDAEDTIVENAGNGVDEVRMFGFGYTLGENVENLRIRGGAVDGTGNALGNTINGSDNDNTLSGLDGNDLLDGKGGLDTLLGGEGNDILIGGTARDTLTGGNGADRFVWRDVSEGNASANFADTITDFSQADGDTISLANIDADQTGGTDNDNFTFIGKAGFSGTPGELRFKFDGGDTIVQIDVDGDAGVDLSIRLTGNIELTAGDFLGVDTSAAVGTGTLAEPVLASDLGIAPMADYFL